MGNVMGFPNGPLRRNWDVRINHVWAMRKLQMLRTIRPVAGIMFVVSLFIIPRELYAQNFGRRNRRMWPDLMPTMVGCASILFIGRYFMGSYLAKSVSHWVGMLGGAAELCWGTGISVRQNATEFFLPRKSVLVYGLPDGGEGFDMIHGGEMATEWKLESLRRSPLRKYGAGGNDYQVRNHAMYENHPLYRLEPGWGPFFGTINFG